MMARATANGWPAGRATATKTDPTSAVPSDDPRLETLRDKPEISPWSASGKLDWTTLTDDVSMTPTPAPNSSNPGTQVRMPEYRPDRAATKSADGVPDLEVRPRYQEAVGPGLEQP